VNVLLFVEEPESVTDNFNFLKQALLCSKFAQTSWV